MKVPLELLPPRHRVFRNALLAQQTIHEPPAGPMLRRGQIPTKSRRLGCRRNHADPARQPRPPRPQMHHPTLGGSIPGQRVTRAWTLRLTTGSFASNSVPRWWLGSYSLTNNWNYDALQVKDHEGIATWQEHIADTNPTNATSYPSLGSAVAGGGVVISWLSSSNRLYTLQQTTNETLKTAWQSVVGLPAIPGSGGRMSVTNAAVGAQDYYRIQIALPP